MKPKSYCHIYGQLDQTGDRLPDELQHMFGLGLVCDASVQFEQAKRHRDTLVELQRHGGLVAPSVYPVDYDSKCCDPNWWKYSEESCLRLLRMAQQRFAGLQLGPLLAVTTYTPGNGFVAACRKLGIRHILGFCAPTVGEDGGWQIAHYGAPLGAYFAAADDYRKPENPASRSDPVLMVNMELRNPLVCLKHWNESPFGPLNAQAVDRWLEPTGEPLPYFAIAEDWLRLAELTGFPRFLNINLQYFFADRCYEHCRRALEWLAEQRDRGRLEVGSIQPWAKQMQASAGLVPHVTYWRGEMMGFHVGHRPGSMPDVVVEENLRQQVVWQYPHITPRRFYDYAKPWKYPAFQPNGTAPASEDVSGITVDLVAGTTAVVRNAGPPRHVPLALWSVLDEQRAPFTVQATGGAQVEAVPHPAGVGGAVLIEREWPTGETRVELTVRSGGRAANRHRRQWGQLLEAQTFEFRHQPYTYLVTQTPERFTVTARARRENVRIESLCGIDYEQRDLPTNGLPLQFDGTRLACWHRFRGITADELEIEGAEEVEARLRRQTTALAHRLAPSLEIDRPGYQLFGDVTAPSRWDRSLARAAGDAELKRIQEWFRRQRPDAGDVVVEAHPGIYLPRGSVTHALAHEFDVVCSVDGYGFQELCADYAQGWDWGVAGWVQWRHLAIRIDGLRANHGRYTLHLHAFDPEGRQIVQRVHAFDPETAPLADAAPLDVCLAREWSLPPGLDGRWNSSALYSVELPSECLRWKALAIWIAPLEKTRLYDWVKDRGAPGILCHAWLTRVA